MRYRLHKLGETKISSAYCPVCGVKTVEITGSLEPQWLGKPAVGLYDGLVSPSNLCCTKECRDIYLGKIETYIQEISDRSILNSPIFKANMAWFVAQGAIPADYQLEGVFTKVKSMNYMHGDNSKDSSSGGYGATGGKATTRSGEGGKESPKHAILALKIS